MSLYQTSKLNINTLNAASDLIYTGTDSFAQASAMLTSGSWGGAVLTVEGSNDKTNWTSLGVTITQSATATDTYNIQGYLMTRFRVSTAASGSGLSRVSITQIPISQLPSGSTTISGVAGLSAALNLKRDITSFSSHGSLVTVSCALLSATGSATLTASWISAGTILVSNPQGNQSLADSAASACDIPGSGSVVIRVQRGLLTPPARSYVVSIIGLNIPGI